MNKNPADNYNFNLNIDFSFVESGQVFFTFLVECLLA